MALARGLLTWPRREELDGVAGKRLIIVQGALLPEIEGLQWLGRSDEDDQLLLPVGSQPELGAAQVIAAVKGRYPGARLPLALLGPSGRCLSLAQATSISVAALERWLAAYG